MIYLCKCAAWAPASLRAIEKEGKGKRGKERKENKGEKKIGGCEKPL